MALFGLPHVNTDGITAVILNTKDMETLLYIILLLQHVSGSNYFVIRKPMSALEAHNACVNKSSTLALPRTDEEEALAKVLNETGQVSLWTGEYVDAVAPWVYARGCWNVDEVIPTTELKQISGSFCLQHCGQHDFNNVLVQQKRCFCGSSNTKVEPYALCRNVCDDGGPCGGTKLYTHYNPCHEAQCLKEFHIERNCAYMDMAGQMKAALCGDLHFPVCVTGSGTDGPLHVFVNISEFQKMSWKDSNAFCRREGGVLADVSNRLSLFKSIVKNTNITSDPQRPSFWVAVNRAKSPTKNLTGTSPLSNSSQCLYVTNDGQGVRYMDCNKTAYACCRNDTNNTNPVLTDQENTGDDTRPESNTPGIQATVDTNLNITNTVPNDADTNQTSDDHQTVEGRSSDPTNTGFSIGYLVLVVVLVLALCGVIIGILVLVKRRKVHMPKGATVRSRPHYDYMEVEEDQTSGISLQSRLVSSPMVSRLPSTPEGGGHGIRNMDEQNYDIMDKRAGLKQNTSGSDTYHSVQIPSEGDYNELQTGTKRVSMGIRDSFYATAQSCSVMEGNYDGFQQRDQSIATESNYDQTPQFR
ncbi:uncharacterized protein [Argopecten irradians]|uniref:uncharacterized protein isoform X2 n=1 Tax=Argopecten irradians TaxID=31199 RepID=UPI0037231576